MTPDEDDLRTLVRDFRASVSADMAEQHRRLDALVDEMRERSRQIVEQLRQVDDRLRIAETAILNEIRALAGRFDRRMERMETRLDELEQRA